MIKVMAGNGAGGVELMTRTWRNYESLGKLIESSVGIC
jgi:hypothetical protein